MTDWEQLRDLTHEVRPPDFESLARTARRRQRRNRAAAGVLAGLVLVGGAFGVATFGGSDDEPFQPAEDPTGELTEASDEPLALPAEDPGEDHATLKGARYRIPLSEDLAVDIDLPDQTFAHDDGLYLASGAIVVKPELAGETYGVPYDPCTLPAIDPVGPTVDDLVEAIRDQDIYHATPPQRVQIGGASGAYLQVRVPRADHARCVRGEVTTPGNPSTAVGWNRGYRGSWWVLDVGGQRVVIQQGCSACTADELDRAAATVQSITFTSTP